MPSINLRDCRSFPGWPLLGHRPRDSQTVCNGGLWPGSTCRSQANGYEVDRRKTRVEWPFRGGAWTQPDPPPPSPPLCSSNLVAVAIRAIFLYLRWTNPGAFIVFDQPIGRFGLLP